MQQQMQQGMASFMSKGHYKNLLLVPSTPPITFIA
jgi:hypothetical protein